MSASTIDHIRMMDELITDLFPRSLTVPTVLIVCCFGTVLLLRKLFSSFVHAAFERELSKAVNASKVTVGSCSIALFTGLFEAKNIVVHTPDRYAWQWDSPLIGRCGYMKVNFSLLSCLPFQRLLRYPAKEIYSVLLCDMQAFVEKRSNVFNYMLLDPSLDLPDPKSLDFGREKSSSPSSLREDTSALTNKAPEDLVVASNNKSTSPSKRKSDVATTALRSFIGSISRANDPGGSGMKGVFKEQAKNLASTMKTLKEQVEEGNAGLENVTKDDALFSRISSNMEDLKEKMNTFSNAPPKKKGWVSKPEKDLFRIGSIVMKDLRVFTKNMIASDDTLQSPTTINPKGWRKPMYFKEVVISGADLSCPSKLRDVTGCPRIGMHSKEISRVLQKRMVAEAGKTNGGTIMQNAFGDLSEYVRETKKKF